MVTSFISSTLCSYSAGSKTLTLILANVRSICNKLDALHVFIDYHKPDIFAVTESWGRPALVDSLITPKGYILFRKDRQDRMGGGVFILVR